MKGQIENVNQSVLWDLNLDYLVKSSTLFSFLGQESSLPEKSNSILTLPVPKHFIHNFMNYEHLQICIKFLAILILNYHYISIFLTLVHVEMLL